MGNPSGNIDFGIAHVDGDVSVSSNFISGNTDAGIRIDRGGQVTVQGNHLLANGSTACSDNILISGGSNISVVGNLIEDAAGAGIEIDGVDAVSISENSITGSGQNGGICSGSYEGMGLLTNAGAATISRNRIYSNGGEGVVVTAGTTNTISRNSIYANGVTTPVLGIDLNRDGVTLNDNGDADSGPNGLNNFPIVSGAFISGSDFVIEGWSRPGATIEVFLSDVGLGTATTGDNQFTLSTDYGEGQLYLGTFVEGTGDDLNAQTGNYSDLDGNTDSTTRYKFRTPLPAGVDFGLYVAATSTLADATSEFSPHSIIKAYTVINNSRIKYRIKKNKQEIYCRFFLSYNLVKHYVLQGVTCLFCN